MTGTPSFTSVFFRGRLALFQTWLYIEGYLTVSADVTVGANMRKPFGVLLAELGPCLKHSDIAVDATQRSCLVCCSTNEISAEDSVCQPCAVMQTSESTFADRSLSECESRFADHRCCTSAANTHFPVTRSDHNGLSVNSQPFVCLLMQTWEIRGRDVKRGDPKVFNDANVGEEARKLFDNKTVNDLSSRLASLFW